VVHAIVIEVIRWVVKFYAR